MVESIETVVIGAGQAGLATSYMLKQQGREHLILEKASQPGNAWRERWDSFTFVTPNWSFRMPGGEYDGPDPDGFMTRSELVSRFDRYAEQNNLPISYNTRVTSVQSTEGGGFLVQGDGKTFAARNVVVANGWFHLGVIPPFASKLPSSILQIHTSAYRNPGRLPPGAILVVGSGQSATQIAEELNKNGRKVFLATGRAPHAPRRYRGRDLFRWMVDSGIVNRPYEQMQFAGRSFVAPMLSGKDGGHALNLHQFHCDGVVLLGHALDYADGRMIFAPDLKENLGKADMGQEFMLKNMDEFIQRAGIDAPLEDHPVRREAYQAPEITSLDLAAEGIQTIIWGSGYRYDASIFQFPILASNGLPNAPMGESQAYPGLFFVGFPFLPDLKAGIVAGVAQRAAAVAGRIHDRQVM